MARPIAIVPSRAFEPGAVIFRQGEPVAGEAFLVHEGTVEIRQRVKGEERLLRTLCCGDLLGEVALFRAGPHSATAVAMDRVTLLVLPADHLEELIRSNPGLAMAIIRQLARIAADEHQPSAPRRPRRVPPGSAPKPT